MSKTATNHKQFSWADLGDIETGRPNLGQLVPVSVYRLMQFTMRHIITAEFGEETANKILYQSGKLAGEEFCKNLLDTTLEFPQFMTEFKKVLKVQKIGILRVEQVDLVNMEILLTVSEDLDCSGLTYSNDTVCDYDEGFIAGVLKVYTGQDLLVKEIDCWASGDRVCRFQINKL